MAKRKLSKQQQRRLKSRQQSHIRHAKKAKTLTQEELAPLESSAQLNGIVITHYGTTTLIEDEAFNVYRCALRQNLGSLVCGDRVIWQKLAETVQQHESDYQGVIIARKERHSLLSRPGFAGLEKPIVANLDQLLIVVAPRPELNEGLIDRYLVAAELSHIPAAIVVNKSDLIPDDVLNDFRQRLATYESLQYPVFFTSVKKGSGIDALRLFLAHKSNALVGQSGVGKSSLINQYIPHADAKTGQLSDYSNKGKHTTSVSTLYHLGETADDGIIIDSPGVREFGLSGIDEEQLIDGFREFEAIKGTCKFRDCKHQQEPGCAIRDAVAAGIISEQRFESYRRIRESLNE